MLFNSFHFAIFFPIVAAAYFALPQRFRGPWLLAASLYFYASWKPAYLGLLLFTTFVDFGVGLGIAGAKRLAAKRAFLAISVGLNLGVLAFFKYFGFLEQTASDVLAPLGVSFHAVALGVVLPVGISFYTFQAMSYTIDVYRGTQAAEPNLGRFVLFVSFFPQLVAGPIGRGASMLPQFDEQHRVDDERIAAGVRLMMWGLFKKAVIADRLGGMVDRVYADPGTHGGPVLTLATIFYAFQIYCDFSGYTDIALGAAQVLGFRLMTNFGRPYFARSLPEFWRRWHISLSTWFRDYVYQPLGGSRVSTFAWYRNLLIVFAVSGVWHGPNWTFVAWGLFHGIGMVLTHAIGGPAPRIAPSRRFAGDALRIAGTFFVVCAGWVFFRAKSLSDALCILGRIPSEWSAAGVREIATAFPAHLVLLIGLVWIVVLLAVEARDEFFSPSPEAAIRSSILTRLPWRGVANYALVLCILFFGVFGDSPFIYFQF